ncbi:MAG TPA: hypothetical protein VKE94_19155, partial [Gemmataceae bacterium]|nr:hypothetical protein [Gemmataceae bacterium]
IEQLSFDHSLVWELARRQRKAPEELQGIPPNVIVRSLGPDASVQVDVEGPHPMQAGDTYLLCSDGLSGPVSDREIGAVAMALPPSEACRFLVQLANMQGGPDNITCMVVRVGAAKPEGNSDATINIASSSSASIDLPSEPLQTRLKRLPWPIILISLGIVLAVFAIWFSIYQLPGSITMFVFAGLTLLGGVLAFMVEHLRENQQQAEPEEVRTLQIYRQTPCTIDQNMIRRIEEARGVLQQLIRENDLKADNALSQQYHEIANRALAAGDLTEAFRARCRAMLVLMEAIHQQHGKGESFKPLWD